MLPRLASERRAGSDIRPGRSAGTARCRDHIDCRTDPRLSPNTNPSRSGFPSGSSRRHLHSATCSLLYGVLPGSNDSLFHAQTYRRCGKESAPSSSTRPPDARWNLPHLARGLPSARSGGGRPPAAHCRPTRGPVAPPGQGRTVGATQPEITPRNPPKSRPVARIHRSDGNFDAPDAAQIQRMQYCPLRVRSDRSVRIPE
jgi:hypothetical protein